MWLRRGRHAAKEIAASHYQADLHTGLRDFGNFLRQRLHAPRVQAEGTFARHHFSAQLEQNALVSGHASHRAQPRFPVRPWRYSPAGFFGRGRVAHFEADETRHRNVFAELGDLGLDQIGNGGGVFLDERLFHQADFFVVFGQPAFDDLVENLLGLALGQRPGARDVLLFFDRGGGHILAPHEFRIGRGHLHGQVLHQFLKVIGARHEIGFAIDFDQHADLRAGMNVVADHALLGRARRLLRRRGDAGLAQDDLCLAQVSLGLDQRLLALHHPRSGAFPELLY